METIQLNYLQPEHSFLPNDTDFSDIESALKHVQRIYTPQDYIHVMNNARKKKPFRVTSMSSNDFLSTENLESAITNRKMTETKAKVNWLHLRQIKLETNEPYKLFVKTDFSQDEYSVINLEKRKKKERK